MPVQRNPSAGISVGALVVVVILIIVVAIWSPSKKPSVITDNFSLHVTEFHYKGMPCVYVRPVDDRSFGGPTCDWSKYNTEQVNP